MKIWVTKEETYGLLLIGILMGMVSTVAILRVMGRI
jgi:hypothetical protein